MRFLFIALFLVTANLLAAQKFLQMERVGKVKVKKYYIGDDLTYRINDDDTWYSGTIQDLKVDEGIILFENRFVRIEDIRVIRKRRTWSRAVGRNMYNFAAGWLLFSAGGTLVGWDFEWDSVLIPAAAASTGFLIQKLFKYKRYKIGKKRRLRMLDLTLLKPIQGP